MPSYDCVVVGAGVFGSWIAYRLQRSGRTVALIDAYGPANARASSGGESRIIRSSYGPDTLYADWAWRSLAAWKQLFELAGEPSLFQKTGVLFTTPENDRRAAQNQASLTRAAIPFEVLSQAQVANRFPQIRFNTPITAVFETQAGVLLARRAVHAVVREAQRLGTHYFQAMVAPPTSTGRMGAIRIGPSAELSAGEFIYACGPWFSKWPPAPASGVNLRDLIVPTRQEIFFFGAGPAELRFAPPAMPVWLDYTDPRGAYSMPDIESRGFKLAFDRHGPACDPDSQERLVSPQQVDAARAFLAERFPALARAPLVEARGCQYENSSNGDFLIDRLPGCENVWLAGGGSGHGFKHGPAVGEYVEQILTGAISPEPRFALATKTSERARSVY